LSHKYRLSFTASLLHNIVRWVCDNVKTTPLSFDFIG